MIVHRIDTTMQNWKRIQKYQLWWNEYRNGFEMHCLECCKMGSKSDCVICEIVFSQSQFTIFSIHFTTLSWGYWSKMGIFEFSNIIAVEWGVN